MNPVLKNKTNQTPYDLAKELWKNRNQFVLPNDTQRQRNFKIWNLADIAKLITDSVNKSPDNRHWKSPLPGVENELRRQENFYK